MRAHVDNFRDKITDYILKLLNDGKNLSLADINKGILSCTKGYQLYSPTLDYLVRRAIGNGYVASVNLGGVEVFNLTQAGADYYKSVSVIWLNTYAVEQSLHLGNTRFADEANADTEFILHQEPDGTISIELAINRPPQYVAPSSLEQIGVFHQLIAQSFVIFVSHISLFCHISCLMKININPVERNRFLILFTRLVFFYSLFITSQKLTDM